MTDAELDLEFAWTTHAESCRDPYSPYLWCRRPTSHTPGHAAGFGAGRVRW